MDRGASNSTSSQTREPVGVAGEKPSDESSAPPETRDDYVSLVDMMFIVLDRRRLVLWTTIVVTVLGTAYSLLATELYVSNATVVREASGDTPPLGSIGGLGALQGFGLNLGLQSGGLTPAAYPKVLESREVRLAVVRDTFYFPTLDRRMTLVEHANQPPGALGTVLKYTVKLPWTLKEALTRGGNRSVRFTGQEEEPSRRITKREYAALKRIDEMMQTSADDATSLMTVTVTAESPDVASAVVERFVVHLRERIRTLRTAKVREQLDFLEDRFREVQDELQQAEDALAQFLQRNQNPTTPALRFEQDRLRRQVSFKEQLYSQLQGQRAQIRLEVQRQQPVVTVVESAVSPIERASPARTLIVILSLIFGFTLGAGLAITLHFLSRNVSEEEERRFWSFFREILPDAVHRRLGEVGSSADGDPMG